MQNPSLTLLKRDERGRVRSTPEMRQAAVAEYQRSGVSATAFAKMAGIAPNTFWNWLHAEGLTQKRPRALARTVARRRRRMRRGCTLIFMRGRMGR